MQEGPQAFQGDMGQRKYTTVVENDKARNTWRTAFDSCRERAERLADDSWSVDCGSFRTTAYDPTNASRFSSTTYERTSCCAVPAGGYT
jgi:hypothetical protein